MLKTAEVEIILSRTICSGKYMVLIGGDVSAITSSVQAGGVVGRGSVIDAFIIPNVHPAVFPAIAGTNTVDVLEALGIIESFSVASRIEAADAAVKAARVTLIGIRLAMAFRMFTLLRWRVPDTQLPEGTFRCRRMIFGRYEV